MTFLRSVVAVIFLAVPAKLAKRIERQPEKSSKKPAQKVLDKQNLYM